MAKKTTMEKTIAEKTRELEEMTDWFYSDDFELDAAAEKYQAAVTLAKEIEKDLDELKNKISVIEKDFTKE